MRNIGAPMYGDVSGSRYFHGDTPMTNPTNLYEAHARERKARKIADWIWRELKPADRMSDLTLQLVRGSRQDIRDVIAANAGQKSPSRETWYLVVEDLRGRIEAVQDGFREGVRRAG